MEKKSDRGLIFMHFLGFLAIGTYIVFLMLQVRKVVANCVVFLTFGAI